MDKKSLSERDICTKFITPALFTVPVFDGLVLSMQWKEALWDRYFTAAPRQRTLSEKQYSDRKLRSRS